MNGKWKISIMSSICCLQQKEVFRYFRSHEVLQRCHEIIKDDEFNLKISEQL